MQSEHVLGPEHAEQLVAYLRFMRRQREQCVVEVAAEFKELPRKPRACLSIERRERAARTCTRARAARGRRAKRFASRDAVLYCALPTL